MDAPLAVLRIRDPGFLTPESGIRQHRVWAAYWTMQGFFFICWSTIINYYGSILLPSHLYEPVTFLLFGFGRRKRTRIVRDIICYKGTVGTSLRLLLVKKKTFVASARYS
jgi:hypothetical protein